MPFSKVGQIFTKSKKSLHVFGVLQKKDDIPSNIGCEPGHFWEKTIHDSWLFGSGPLKGTRQQGKPKPIEI